MNNNKSIKYLSSLVLLIAFLFVGHSCTNDDYEGIDAETTGVKTYRLIWDGYITGFGGGTRATVKDKADGDRVWLRLKAGDNYVNGEAVYEAASGEWKLTCNGLKDCAGSPCEAYFANNISVAAGGSEILLNHETPIYRDLAATYSKEKDVVRLTAKLTPVTGRIRFKGAAGSSFLFSGVQSPVSFNTKSFELIMKPIQLDMTVGNSGYTPYVYALATAERTMSIYYDNQTYKKKFESPILDAGRTGYMLLPTKAAHNGWELYQLELPSLSIVSLISVSDVSAEVTAKVTSLGNGTLQDAGFVYSTAPNPTLESTKISCGAVETISAFIEGLTPETDYYVRAYAINEMGTNYSQQMTIRTTAVPTIPAVKTVAVMTVKTNSAEVMGAVVDFGQESKLLKHGFVWGTMESPTLSNSSADLGELTKVADFFHTITNLQPNTKYYFRAFATNSQGTAYGEPMSFTTKYGNVALTTEIGSVRYDGAEIITNITELGGYTIAERGICWGTAAEPTLNDNKIVATVEDRQFSSTITGLAEQTTYRARSYIILKDNNQTVYANVVEFTTPLKDAQIGFDEYETEDEDWTKGSASADSEIGKDDFGNDEDVNKGSSSEGTEIGKDDFGADEDINKGSDSKDTEVGKDDFGSDEDWSSNK